MQNNTLIIDLEGTLLANDLAVERRLGLLTARDPFPELSDIPVNKAALQRIANWVADGGKALVYSQKDPALAQAFCEIIPELSGACAADDVEQKISSGATHLAPSLEPVPGQPARGIRSYVRALRPHQWLKNILVFLPLIAGHRIDADAILAAAIAFAAFSLVASGVYIINDLLDLPSDRAHPRKKNRPFASGAIPARHGLLLAPLLFIAGFGMSAALGPRFMAVLALYLVITTAYSFWLKKRAIVDICTLAILYTVRIIAGGEAAHIPLSVWLLAFSIFLFFSLAAIKRQAELIVMMERNQMTATGRGYHTTDLPLVSQMSIAAGYVSVLVMALYLNSPEVRDLYSRPELLWGICLVLLYWVNRMVIVTHRGYMHDDPVVYAVRDRISQICFLLVAACVFGGSII